MQCITAVVYALNLSLVNFAECPKLGVIVSYPADIVLALCGDGLIDHFLAANAEKNFFNFVQEFLQRKNVVSLDCQQEI